MSENNPACFNCCSLGGGMFKPYEGTTTWWLGLDAAGQAHYACNDCAPLLILPTLADPVPASMLATK
jgi:hypothetical protein